MPDFLTPNQQSSVYIPAQSVENCAFLEANYHQQLEPVWEMHQQGIPTQPTSRVVPNPFYIPAVGRAFIPRSELGGTQIETTAHNLQRLAQSAAES